MMYVSKRTFIHFRVSEEFTWNCCDTTFSSQFYNYNIFNILMRCERRQEMKANHEIDCKCCVLCVCCGVRTLFVLIVGESISINLVDSRYSHVSTVHFFDCCLACLVSSASIHFTTDNRHRSRCIANGCFYSHRVEHCSSSISIWKLTPCLVVLLLTLDFLLPYIR